jgi:hypothetical protein
MKLPVQAPAVVREGLSWPIRRPAGPGVEPAGCKVCLEGGNPCSGNLPDIVACPSGTCQCCASGQKWKQEAGGACTCKN